MSSVSIITVTFNAAVTIAQCIDSVAGQKVSVEHIIIDGASDDGTLNIVKEKSSSVSKILSERDKGIYDAMNKGLALAEGEIIGFLNADDFYASDDVLASVRKAFEDPAVDACYGDLLYVDPGKTGRSVRYWRSDNYNPKKFYWGWMPPHPTFFVRRRIYEKYGGFNTELGSAADYEIMLRFLLKHRSRAVYLSRVLVKMRTGGISNASLVNRLRANRMDRKAWTVNELQPYPWTILAKPLRKLSQWLVLDKPWRNDVKL